jgi:hypothetical protein
MQESLCGATQVVQLRDVACDEANAGLDVPLRQVESEHSNEGESDATQRLHN